MVCLASLPACPCVLVPDCGSLRDCRGYSDLFRDCRGYSDLFRDCRGYSDLFRDCRGYSDLFGRKDLGSWDKNTPGGDTVDSWQKMERKPPVTRSTRSDATVRRDYNDSK